MDLTKSSAEDLKALHVEAAARFDGLRGRNLSLDITRGKPSADQLSLSDDLLTSWYRDSVRASVVGYKTWNFDHIILLWLFVHFPLSCAVEVIIL